VLNLACDLNLRIITDAGELIPELVLDTPPATTSHSAEGVNYDPRQVCTMSHDITGTASSRDAR